MAKDKSLSIELRLTVVSEGLTEWWIGAWVCVYQVLVLGEGINVRVSGVGVY
jgi:hypothetical protein